MMSDRSSVFFCVRLGDATGVFEALKIGKKNITGWWFGTSILFSHILGMSSSQLTFIFFRGVQTTNQISSDGLFHPSINCWECRSLNYPCKDGLPLSFLPLTETHYGTSCN